MRARTSVHARPVQIRAGAALIDGDLVIPDRALGLVVFAHGSGSSRFSRRNRAVAETLEDGGFATLLLDLLTREEEAIDVRTREYRFDIDRLGHRVVAAIDWAAGESGVSGLPVGCFGASTGAAAALIAAAERPDNVRAVISRGGRPDLAGDVLPRVGAPTLLIVGGADEPVIELNRQAMRRMRAPRRARGHSWRNASVRGARHARGSGAAGPGMVQAPSRKSAPVTQATQVCDRIRYGREGAEIFVVAVDSAALDSPTRTSAGTPALRLPPRAARRQRG